MLKRELLRRGREVVLKIWVEPIDTLTQDRHHRNKTSQEQAPQQVLAEEVLGGFLVLP